MNITLLESLGADEKIIVNFKNQIEAKGYSFTQYSSSKTKEEQIERLKNANAVIIANTKMFPEAIEQANNLKYIDIAFTGTDHIPVQLAKEKGIQLSNASGYATEAVAELTIALMIDILRDIKEADIRTRHQQTKQGLTANLLGHKTVGIIGAGAIGRQVAKLAKAFGCKVISYQRHQITDSHIDKQTDLNSLLRESDIVSIHTPLTDETRNLISKKELELMKPTSILINTARGAVVNTKDLADALNNGVIRAAGIDVFDVEPPIPADNPLLTAKNCLLTPHIGFYTQESMNERAKIVFNNMLSWLDGNILNQI